MADATVAGEDQAPRLRQLTIDKLIADEFIGLSEAEAAFRKIAREAFSPGDFPLDTVYATHEMLRGRRDVSGPDVGVRAVARD